MNPPVEVPVQNATPLYTQRVTLEGRDYLLRFDWNGREGRWYLDVGTVDEVWIVTGVKVICNWPLFRTLTDDRKPPGYLMAADLSPEGGEPPGFYDLGQRVKLLYFPASS
jgi:hypothetical protein